jgi:hypothetical protein
VPVINENAVSNVLVDVDFLEDELKRIGRAHLTTAFVELRSVSCFLLPPSVADIYFDKTTSIPLSNTVQEYLVPAVRHTSYAAVKHKRLQALLDKLAKFGATQRDAASRELADKRRKEADAVGRVFPGEGR